VLAALARRGTRLANTAALYPVMETADAKEVLDLEVELQRDLALAA